MRTWELIRQLLEDGDDLPHEFYLDPPEAEEEEEVKVEQGLDRADMPQVQRIIKDEFDQFDAGAWDYVRAHSDMGLSFKAMLGPKIAGVYMLGNRQLEPEFHGMKGVEGVALAVAPQYRSQGIGKVLISAPKDLGVDYVWGLQLKSLGNIGHWLKRRKIVREDEECYATAEIYSKKGYQHHLPLFGPTY